MSVSQLSFSANDINLKPHLHYDGTHNGISDVIQRFYSRDPDAMVICSQNELARGFLAFCNRQGERTFCPHSQCGRSNFVEKKTT